MNSMEGSESLMIRSLHLQNFKCFENQHFEFNTLNLLAGLNGTGKSSVLQALLLLRQSYQQNSLQSGDLSLNGDLIHIGTAKDAFFEGAKEDVISFGLTLGNGAKETWRFHYDRETDVLAFIQKVPGAVDSILSSTSFDNSSLFGNTFQYLQAERIGPRRFFETSDVQVRKQRQLGAAGEYTAHFLATFGKLENIANSILGHPEAVSNTLYDQVEAWLGEISAGTHITLTPNLETDTVILQYSFVTGTQESNKYRATNVGFGITYALPIIVAVLSSVPGSLLLIENPEAHLHPRGQARIGELLALAASCGIQVVIETHSDHVLNGIRLAVHGGKLPPDMVRLHFFERSQQDGQALVTSLHIDRNGRIDRWPDGFFDEWDKSLETLLMPGDI